MSLCKCSAEPSRSSGYSCDLRWRIVYQHLRMGLSCRDVAKHLNVDSSTVSRIVSRFDETGSVDPTDIKGVKGGEYPNIRSALFLSLPISSKKSYDSGL